MYKEFLQTRYVTKSEHHLKRYVKLIDHYLTNFTNAISERHHILPKAMWPEHDDKGWNFVSLPLKAHFLAHYLIWKAFRTEQSVQAFQLMCRVKSESKSHLHCRLYAAGKKAFRATQRERKLWHCPETKQIKFTKKCPPGFISGTGIDPSRFIPNKLFWMHNPETGENFRIEDISLISAPFVAGRCPGWNNVAWRKVNSTPRYFCLSEKEYFFGEPVEWSHIPTQFMEFKKAKVYEWRGVKYLTGTSRPKELRYARSEFDIIKCPHWNMAPEMLAFTTQWSGKTYKEAGLTISNLIDHVFIEGDKIEY